MSHDGSGSRFYAKRHWIASVTLVVLVGLFAAWVYGLEKKQRVFLVNGTSRPYSVVIRGREHSLAPGVATPVGIPKGDVEVAYLDPSLGLAPVRFTIESYSDRTLVINPDRAAVMVQQQKWYAAKDPPPCGPSHIHAGQEFYDLPPFNYVFQEFPKTIREPGAGAKRKTGINLLGQTPLDGRLVMLLQRVPASEHDRYFERLLRFEPGNDLRLCWLAGKLTRERTPEHLKAHADWHGLYQSLMERAHPEADLRPRYQKLLADLPGNAQAAYLLARVETDPGKAGQLYRQAAAGEPPSEDAMIALGDAALSNGSFAEAVSWYEKVSPALPKRARVRSRLHEALLANREYDRLLDKLKAQLKEANYKISALMEIGRVYAVMGDKANSRAAVAELAQATKAEQADDDDDGGESMAPTKYLDSRVCCWEYDVAGYLKARETARHPSFEVAFLRGNLEQAADTLKQFGTTTQHALLYLAAERAGAKDLALAQWRALTEVLAKGTRDDRLLADVLLGRKPIADHPPQRLPLPAMSKRVYLAVFAQRHPERAKEALALAEKLDFYRDDTSLCLRKVLTDTMP